MFVGSAAEMWRLQSLTKDLEEEAQEWRERRVTLIGKERNKPAKLRVSSQPEEAPTLADEAEVGVVG